VVGEPVRRHGVTGSEVGDGHSAGVEAEQASVQERSHVTDCGIHRSHERVERQRALLADEALAIVGRCRLEVVDSAGSEDSAGDDNQQEDRAELDASATPS
jgi:hypothetical protein